MIKKAKKITTNDIEKLNVDDCTVIAMHKRPRPHKHFAEKLLVLTNI